MAMFYALLGLCLAGGALAQLPGWGPCPRIDAMQDFDSSKFEGKWYESQRYFAAFEFFAQCVVTEYSSGEDGTMQLAGSAISALTGRPMFVDAVVHVPDFAEPAKFRVEVSSAPVASNFSILETDYNSYAVVYSCLNMELLHFKNVWILTREQQPLQDTIDEALAVMKKNKLRKRWLMKTQQSDCEVQTEEFSPEQIEE